VMQLIICDAIQIHITWSHLHRHIAQGLSALTMLQRGGAVLIRGPVEMPSAGATNTSQNRAMAPWHHVVM
jgi:hypothetical protein